MAIRKMETPLEAWIGRHGCHVAKSLLRNGHIKIIYMMDDKALHFMYRGQQVGRMPDIEIEEASLPHAQHIEKWFVWVLRKMIKREDPVLTIEKAGKAALAAIEEIEIPDPAIDSWDKFDSKWGVASG